MKNSKIFWLALALTVLPLSGLWAQSWGQRATDQNAPAYPSASLTLPNGWASPQSDATQGRYRSAADDFIRPDSYKNVKFDKWYGFTSLRSTNVPALGFATNVGDLYIGAFYTGTLWAGLQSNYNNSEYTMTDLFDAGGSNKTYTVHDSKPEAFFLADQPYNSLAVLIGVADMGFRLAYTVNHQAFDKNDIVFDMGGGTYEYWSDYHHDYGYHDIQIAWAMAKDLTDNGIRPYATIDLYLMRDYVKGSQKLVDDGTFFGANVDPGDSLGDEVENNNWTTLTIGMGLGGYTLSNKDGFKLSADFDYAIAFDMYDNEFSYVDTSDVNKFKYKTTKIQGLYDNMSALSESRHTIEPSLSGSWSRDNIAFKFKFVPQMRIAAHETTEMGFNVDNKMVKDGVSENLTQFAFRPDLRLAMQWKIFSGKLALNVSERLQASAITLTTIDQEVYVMDTKQSSGTTKQETFGGAFTNELRLGVTFAPTDFFILEAVMGNQTTGVMGGPAANGYTTTPNNSISVFGTGGTNSLFNFGSILIGFKF